MSVGLFIRAIAQSGAVFGGWPINRDPLYLTNRLAGLLGCDSTSSQQIYNCLKDLSAQDIQNASLGIKVSFKRRYIYFVSLEVMSVNMNENIINIIRVKRSISKIYSTFLNHIFIN